MPSIHILCPYCSDTPVSEHLFKHILSKHEACLFTGENTKVIQYNRKIISEKIGKLSPPTLYLTTSKDLLNPYYCCLGCSTAVKKYKFAIPHFPDCFEAHDKKRKELEAKYPLESVKDISATTVFITSTVTTTVRCDNPFVLAALEKYYKRIQELEEDNKKADKKAYRLRQYIKLRHPDVAEEYNQEEEDISDISDVEIDPNELLRRVVKEHKVEFKIVKTLDEDGNIKFSV